MINTNLVLGSWRPGEWPEYVTVSHEGWREFGRRYVPERTCRISFDEEVGCWRCSECGWELTPGEEQFCPMCGAKVMTE